MAIRSLPRLIRRRRGRGRLGRGNQPVPGTGANPPPRLGDSRNRPAPLGHRTGAVLAAAQAGGGDSGPNVSTFTVCSDPLESAQSLGEELMAEAIAQLIEGSPVDT